MFSAVKKPRKLKRILLRKVTRDWLTSENTCITRKDDFLEMFQIAPFEVLDILLDSEDAGLTEKYVVSTLFWKVSVLCKWIFACKCKSATADRIRWLQLQGASPLKWSYHQRRSSCNIIHHHRHHRVLTKNIQGVSKKRYFLGFCLISLLEVRFYFFTCVSESEFRARFI